MKGSRYRMSFNCFYWFSSSFSSFFLVFFPLSDLQMCYPYIYKYEYTIFNIHNHFTIDIFMDCYALSHSVCYWSNQKVKNILNSNSFTTPSPMINYRHDSCQFNRNVHVCHLPCSSLSLQRVVVVVVSVSLWCYHKPRCMVRICCLLSLSKMVWCNRTGRIHKHHIYSIVWYRHSYSNE